MIADLVNKYNRITPGTFNELDIDDIFQDSILVLIEKEHSPTFTLTVKPSTFLYSIAENKIKERIRSNGKMVKTDIDEVEIDDKDEDYDLEKDTLRELRRKILRECIKLLSESQRKIFILFHYNNYSMKQIAQQFDSNERSMITQKYKASKSVQDCVKSK